MVQVIECLSGKLKDLSSNPRRITKKKKERNIRILFHQDHSSSSGPPEPVRCLKITNPTFLEGSWERWFNSRQP
jgi:hypothetical protein